MTEEEQLAEDLKIAAYADAMIRKDLDAIHYGRKPGPFERDDDYLMVMRGRSKF